MSSSICESCPINLSCSANAKEETRLAFVEGLDLVGRHRHPVTDSVVRLVAAHFDVPVALVAIVARKRVWLLARHGVADEWVPRTAGLCASMLDDAVPFVDFRRETGALRHEMPTFRGKVPVRFWAGAPLVSRYGYRLGALLIADEQPRQMGSDDLARLSEFSSVVTSYLDLRESKREVTKSLTHSLQESARNGDREEYLRVCAWSKQVRVDGEWITFDEFLEKILGLPVSHGLAPGVEVD